MSKKEKDGKSKNSAGDILSGVSVTDATTLGKFWKPGRGKNGLCIVSMPSEPTEVEIDGKILLKLHIPVIISSKGTKLLRTWSVNYKESVGSTSLLAQLIQIKKSKDIENWSGVVLNLTKVGKGRTTRYTIEFVKKLAEKDFEDQRKEAAKNTEKEAEEEEEYEDEDEDEDVSSLFQ